MTGDLADKLEDSSISRQEIILELERQGIDTSSLCELSLDQLEELLKAVERLSSNVSCKKRQSAGGHSGKNSVISSLDKKILLALLSCEGRISSIALSKETGAPLSTVQRRRKRLETDLIKVSYLLKMETLGWHAAMVFISTQGGTSNEVGQELLSWKKSVICVSRAAVEEATDIVAQVVFHGNEDLLDIIGRVRATKGVRRLFWIELVSALGKNSRYFEFVIDRL
jgi:DNA-binding Lrp family transcriptional regulator